MGAPWDGHCTQQSRDEREPGSLDTSPGSLRFRCRRDARRLIALLAVVGAHTALLVLLTHETDRRAIGEAADHEPAMVWLPPPLDIQAPPAPSAARHPQPPPTSRTRMARSRAARPATQGAPLVPPTTALNPPPESLTSPPIDWQEAMDAAAAHQLARADERRRQSAMFATPAAPASLAAPQAHGPPFRWDYAATHRVEFTPHGALYINLNDRCLYMFPIFLLCRFGEIPSHGDLLQHARHAPAEP